MMTVVTMVTVMVPRAVVMPMSGAVMVPGTCMVHPVPMMRERRPSMSRWHVKDNVWGVWLLHHVVELLRWRWLM